MEKKDYKPVVYGALFGVLVIVLFGVLYTSRFAMVGQGYNISLADDPTVFNLMDITNGSDNIPVIGDPSSGFVAGMLVTAMVLS